MKKIISLIMVFAICITGCNWGDDESSSQPIATDGKDIRVSSNGYAGELVLDVRLNGENIEDIAVVSTHESSVVWSRAFPIIRERILSAQSPIVDNVSGATLSSYAVKTAVADALKQNGKDFGSITVNTAPEKKEPIKLEDVKTQLVIIGGGSAGLSAGISAKENGVNDVIIIEKLDILSGNGKFNMNFFDLYNSQAQNNANNTMTKEDFIKEKTDVSDSSERVNVWAEEAFNLDEWLRGMGIELNYNYGSTNHMAESNAYAGEHIQEKMETRAKELGIDIRTATKGTDLIMQNGNAVGVKVENRDGYYNINANSVIVATGGFSANKDLLAEYAPGAERVATSNQIGATGDFIPIFEKYDIKLNNLDKLSIFPYIIKNRRDLTGGGQGFILVNKEGNRFIDERKGDMELANAILDQPESKAYYIYDQRLFDSAYRLQKHTDLGYHQKADTLEELATHLGVNASNLKTTVENHNKAVRGEVADSLRDVPSEKEIALNGPFYGVQVESAIHMTKGGVVANEKAEVLLNSGEIVKNLYAAGEVTDTSGSYSASVVFGKIAGREAAKNLLNK